MPRFDDEMRHRLRHGIHDDAAEHAADAIGASDLASDVELGCWAHHITLLVLVGNTGTICRQL